MARHYVVPDAQLRAGVPSDHIDWIAADIVRRKPDAIIVLGDWWDFAALNSHVAPGSAATENQRIEKDLIAGNLAFAKLAGPIQAEIDRCVRRKIKRWNPRRVFLFGNHEDRLRRAVERDPKWSGIIGDHLMLTPGFERHAFLERVWIDGLVYAHYFQSSHSSHAIGGSIDNRLNKIGASFVQGHEQGLRYGTRIQASGATWHGLVAGSCLTPDHRVLTADLRYVELGSVAAGDKLVSFDEQIGQDGGRSRRYRTGTVEAVRRDEAELFEVTLSTGKAFKVTADHLWLTRKAGTTTGWLRTDELVTADSPRFGASHVPVLLQEWEQDKSYEAGWLAGMYDGEGCLYKRKTTGGDCMQLTLTQLPGAVLNRATDALRSVLGLTSLTDTNNRGVVSLRVQGGRCAIAKVLGTLRPTRLLPKFSPEQLGRVNIKEWARVESVRPIGSGEIVRIAIDAKTMVVEGYGHHNCYLHREEYRGNQGQKHWRGCVVLNEVKDGDYCVMPLTLDYYARKYAGKPLPDYMQAKYPQDDWTHLA